MSKHRTFYKRIFVCLLASMLIFTLTACNAASYFLDDLDITDRDYEVTTEATSAPLAIPEPEQDNSSNNLEVGQFDPPRTGHDIGTCRTLSEDAAIVVLCADDDISSWDASSIEDFREQVEWASRYLCNEASVYGVELTLPVFVYAANDNRQIRYSGIINTGGEHLDALSSIAANWGFDDKWDMHRTLQEHLQAEQIVYIVAHYKETSYPTYAQAVSHGYASNGWNLPEYCVIPYYGHGDCGVSIVHEVLHTFGAQDFYAKDFGTGTVKYNANRAALAQTLCPNDVMLCQTYDRDRVEISTFTAYTIGWLDELPYEYDCPEWWVGSQWESIYSP